MQRVLLAFFFIFLFGLFQSALAQTNQIIFEHISKNQGLVDNAVTSFVQDQEGFLWIGTDNGLNRYDGFQFLTYQHKSNNPNSLSNNRISALYADSQNRLWVGNYEGGVDIFDLKTKSFTKILNLGRDTQITSVYLDTRDNLWICSVAGLIKLNLKTKNITKFLPENTEQVVANSFFSIAVENPETLWLNSVYGIYRFDIVSETFTKYLNIANPISFIGPTAIECKLLFDPSGRLFIPTQDSGLYILDTKTGKLISHYRTNPKDSTSLITDTLTNVLLYDKNSLWIGTPLSGLEHLDLETGKFTHYQNDPKNPNSLAGDNIHALYKDRSNIFWVSNGIYGISKYSPYKYKFPLYQYNRYLDNGLSNNYLRGIFQDRSGIVWIGTQFGGLNRLDRKTGQIQTFHHNSQDPYSLILESVWAVYEDSQGEFWVGTYGVPPESNLINGKYYYCYLQKLDRKTGKFTIFNDQISGVTKIYESRDGTLWLGASQGLGTVYSISPDRKTIRSFRQDFGARDFAEIQAIIEDSFGDMWFGASYGLFRYNRKTNTITDYFNNPQDSNTLSNNSVTSFLEDSKGTFWITTKGGGVCKFNREKNSFTRLVPPKEEDLNSTVYAMFEDKQSNFWLSTDNGIVKYNPKDNSFITFGIADGVQNKEFNRFAYHQNKDGEIFFGGTNGLNIFNPNNIRINSVVPPVVITTVKLFNTDEDLRIKNSYQEPITLDYNQNYVVFEYIALDFHSPESNLYQYKLEGLDKDWIDAKGKREITYSSLAAGEYTFQVKASNNDKVWNTVGASIKIIIYPPLWRRWWAYLSYCLIGLLLVQYRFYALKKRNLVLEQKVQDRTIELEQTVEQLQTSEKNAIQVKDEAIKASYAKSAFLAMMSHEIRTPMNGIIGMTALLMNTKLNIQQSDFVETIRISGESLLTIINDILDFSKIESGKLELEKVSFDLRECIDQVIDLLTPQTTQKGLKINYTLTNNTSNKLLADVTRLRQILVNLISNAIKFTTQGEVSILVSSNQISKNFYELSFQVKDTGIGIADEQLTKLFQPFSQVDTTTTRKYGGTGLGLTISKHLCELMGGRIWVESQLGVGSVFYFTILAEGDLSTEVSPSVEKPIKTPKLATELPLKILLADDNLINQKVAISILRNFGYTPDTAANGLKVLEMLKEQLYDVILMDVQMPEMDGLTATKEIHKSYTNESRPRIIAITAGAMDADKQECLDAGMDDFISKPVNLDKLATALRLCTPHKKKQDEESKEHQEEILDSNVLKNLLLLQDNNNPDFLASMIEIFLMEIPFKLDELSKAINQKDQQTLKFVAHSLKGYCGNLGASRMKKLSSQLEEMSFTDSLKEINNILTKLEQEFTLVNTALKAELEKSKVKEF